VNVRGDHDVVATRLIDDPVVSRVEGARYDLHTDPRRTRHLHPRICDERDREAVALRDSHDLGLHRAGVGVDIDPWTGMVSQLMAVTAWPSVREN
jgi:hypothetical protein